MMALGPLQSALSKSTRVDLMALQPIGYCTPINGTFLEDRSYVGSTDYLANVISVPTYKVNGTNLSGKQTMIFHASRSFHHQHLPSLFPSQLEAFLVPQELSQKQCYQCPVTARKDDAPAADQAAMSNVAGWCSISVGGGLIQTTSG
jgi:hypothetical protein